MNSDYSLIQISLIPTLCILKGALDNIFKFSFKAEFRLSYKNLLLIYKYKTKNSKSPSKSEKNHQFLLSMHKVVMRLICIHVAV